MRLINFLFLYMLFPAAIVLIAMRSGNWFLLFAILLYAVGIIISQFRQWIFFPIPMIFAFWYWYTYGMGPTDYVFIYTASFLAGVAFSEASKKYHKFVKKILPEQMDNIDYNEKVEELNRRIEQFRKEHPNQKVTADVVEKIRTEVFF